MDRASWNTVVTSRSVGVHARGPLDGGVAGSVSFTCERGEVEITVTLECDGAFEAFVGVDGVPVEATRVKVAGPLDGYSHPVGWYSQETVVLDPGEHEVAVYVSGEAMYARCSIEVNHG